MLKADQKEIIRLFRAGYHARVIAEKLNMSESAVNSKIKYLRKKGIEVKRWWEQ